MEWRTRYVVKSYLTSSMWLIPLVAYVVSLISIEILTWIDGLLHWRWAWALDGAVVQSVLQMFIAAMLSFIVFTFGSLLVAVQIASAQLTPRIIATVLLRDNTIRTIAALLILSFVFDLGLLARSQTAVLYVPLTVALLLNLMSIGAFLYLMDYAARLLRPISVLWHLGESGLRVIEEVYPVKLEADDVPPSPPPVLGAPTLELFHRRTSAIVLAINLDILRLEAERTEGVIELSCRVGDFVPTGQSLFRLYGGAAAANQARVRATIAMGRERTIEQDATFAFRVIVDIAIKALSSAINDPTTAVLSIDQLHRLLLTVGRRSLHDDCIRDAAGRLRVIYRTPGWDDFVQLSCREIRLYGAANFQIARRLRAMLENLQQALPQSRWPALHKELELLDETLVRLNLLPDDLALSRKSDLHGLGASPHYA